MVRGVGIDIMLISRMQKSMAKPGFPKRVFTPEARAYISERTNEAQTAAGIFCAK